MKLRSSAFYQDAKIHPQYLVSSYCWHNSRYGPFPALYGMPIIMLQVGITSVLRIYTPFDGHKSRVHSINHLQNI